MAFVSGFIKLSASELACGRRGVILLCLTLLSYKYLLNLWFVNGDLLSLHNTVGMPCVAKIHSSFGIVVDADVDCTTSTSRNLEYASMTTNRYSLVGNGPQKSM